MIIGNIGPGEDLTSDQSCRFVVFYTCKQNRKKRRIPQLDDSGSEIRKTHQLRLIVYPIIYKVYTPANMSPENQWLEDVFPTEIVLL